MQPIRPTSNRDPSSAKRPSSASQKPAQNDGGDNIKEQILFCWSGGKDSAMALAELLRAGNHQIAALLTTVTEDYDRVSMHGVRCALLEAQAAALGLPLHIVRIPAACTNEIYETSMKEAMEVFLAQGVRRVAFGDLYLADVREYRERNLARAGMEAIFPLWQRDTAQLARAFIAQGYRAALTCVDTRKLDASFAGREFDESLLGDLPPGVDPCGENGEFHSFVFDGPIFRHPIAFTRGVSVSRDSFCFTDLLPAGQLQSASF